MEKMITLEEYARKQEKRKNTVKKTGVTAFFLGPYLFCFALFFVFPFIYGIIISFYSFDGKSLIPSTFVGFENYIKVFTSPILIKDFWGSVWNTIRFALIIVPLCLVIPLGLALLCNIKPPGYKIFRACIYIPGIFPLTATGLILLRMFSYQNGFINAFFNISIDWFGEATTTWFMIGLFCIWGGIGGNFLIFSAGLENVDKTLYEAANVDGCSKWHKFLYVTLPGIKNQFVICLFTTLVGYMNLYGQNFILGSNTPDQGAIKTAIFRIQDILMGSSRGYGIASSMAITLGVIIAFIGAIQMIATLDKKGGHKYETAYMAWKKSN